MLHMHDTVGILNAGEDSQETGRKLVEIVGSAGMRSSWDDLEWHYGRKQRFSWKRRMANGLPLSHPSNRNFWTLARRYQAGLRNQISAGRSNALETIFGKTHVVLAACDLAIRLGLSSLAEFDEIHHQVVLREFNEGRTGFSINRVTRARLEHVFTVFSDLHELFVYPLEDGTFLLNDGFRFALFLSKDDQVAVAKAGTVSDQTDDLPEDVVFAHIAAAIEYVAVYADDILELDRRWKEILSKPVQELTRARPGEATARVAQLLQDAVLKGQCAEVLTDNIVNRRVVSELAKIQLPTLYEKRFAILFDAVQQYLDTPSLASRQIMLTVLEAPIVRFAQVARKVPERRAPTAEIGLPFKGVDGEFAPWPLTSLGANSHQDHSLEEAKSDLWSACYILVLAYLAVRLDEGLSVRSDCIVEKVDGPYLSYRVSKNMNSDGGSLVERPVPDIVVRA
jgi:hypothetical protein